MPNSYRTLHASRKTFTPLHNRGIPIADEPKTIGQHLRRRRAQLKLHQRQVARMLQVSMVTLSKWERDHTYPTWKYHERIISYLGQDAFKLMEPKDPYSNKSRGVAFFPDQLCVKIGQRIHEKRLELRLTVKQCASELGVAARTLRDWEACLHVPLKRFEAVLNNFLGEPPSTTAVKNNE